MLKVSFSCNLIEQFDALMHDLNEFLPFFHSTKEIMCLINLKEIQRLEMESKQRLS